MNSAFDTYFAEFDENNDLVLQGSTAYPTEATLKALNWTELSGFGELVVLYYPEYDKMEFMLYNYEDEGEYVWKSVPVIEDFKNEIVSAYNKGKKIDPIDIYNLKCEFDSNRFVGIITGYPQYVLDELNITETHDDAQITLLYDYNKKKMKWFLESKTKPLVVCKSSKEYSVLCKEIWTIRENAVLYDKGIVRKKSKLFKKAKKQFERSYNCYK